MSWLQTLTGRAADLLEPHWRMVDLDRDLPEALAKLARFTGHTCAGPYSVAQHSVIGADAVYRDTGDKRAAACFLLHDGREYVLGDKSTPVKRAELAIIAEQCGAEVAEQVAFALRELGKRQDQAIFAAAGLGNNGMPERYAALVHDYDLRMLATERRHLLGKPPKPWADEVEAAKPIRMVGGLTAWPWPQAADEFRRRLRKYLPDLFEPESFRSPPRPAPQGARRAPRTLQTLEA